MAKDWTDAEFVVVWAPPRRRRPRPYRVRAFLALCVAAPLLSLIVYLVAEALHHWRA